MPIFTITDSKTGRSMDVRGDHAPTQEEATALFAQQPAPRSRTWTDTAVDLLPAAGGTLGGIVGGMGGTVAGMGIGGVPGAMGGAALGGGAGEAVRQLVNRARGVEAPATSGQALTDIGTQGGEQGALEGVGAAVSPLLVKGGQAVYRGFLKPSLAAKNVAKADQIVQTAINESLPVTAAGANTARKVIGQLRSEVDRILANTPGDIDIHDIADRLRTWANTMYNRPGRAPSDLKAALDVADRIDAHPSMPATPTTPAVTEVNLTTANQIKRDLQSGASSAYGVKSGAEKTTEKESARMMRQGIETLAPDVGPLNARESRLIDAARAISQATGREANRNALFGVPTIMSGIAGGEEYRRTGDPYTSAAKALVLRAGLHPAIATRLAYLAAQLGAKMPNYAPAAVARAAYQVMLETSSDNAGQ